MVPNEQERTERGIVHKQTGVVDRGMIPKGLEVIGREMVLKGLERTE
jgi:hypothetical protein